MHPFVMKLYELIYTYHMLVKYEARCYLAQPSEGLSAPASPAAVTFRADATHQAEAGRAADRKATRFGNGAPPVWVTMAMAMIVAIVATMTGIHDGS